MKFLKQIWRAALRNPYWWLLVVIVIFIWVMALSPLNASGLADALDAAAPVWLDWGNASEWLWWICKVQGRGDCWT